MTHIIIEEGIVKDADPQQAEDAARLAKADLVTGMVGEFPELQGVMGGYYARAEGLPDAVADAIRDHYKPVGQGDEVPTAPVTVAVSLADKLDTLVVFFIEDMAPSGSRDPFALRRAAIGTILLIVNNSLRGSLKVVIQKAGRLFFESAIDIVLREKNSEVARSSFIGDVTKLTINLQDSQTVRRIKEVLPPEVQADLDQDFDHLMSFFADRLKVQQREAGVRHDLIDAVFALGGEDDLVRLLARVKALQAFVETADGANLLAGYRRAANILRAEAKKGGAAPAEFAGFAYAPDPAEAALADALDTQLPLAEHAIAAQDFAAAMTALSALRVPIDRFFDDVTVNADDPEQRGTRLALLAKLVAAMHKVADFSKIEG